MKIQEILSNTFLAVLSIFLVFCLLEIVATSYLLYWADKDKFIRYASWDQLQNRKNEEPPRYSKHRYLSYYPTPNYVKDENRHNSLGYRGEEILFPKPPGQFRIACLGGSTTYSSSVADYRESWPALLEKYMREKGFENVRVINAGAEGWGSWESLINFELRVLDLEPDMIIIYHGINDIHPRFVWPPKAYRGDNSGYRGFNESAIFMPSIFEYSTLLRMLMIRAGFTTSHAAFDRHIDRIADTSYQPLFASQKREKIYPQAIFKEISAMKMLEVNKPVYFERNIRNIIAIAKNRGIEVIVSSFAYSPLFNDLEEVSSEEYVFAHEENNRLLKKIAQNMNVNLFDMASNFPTLKRYYMDGQHVNKDGAKLRAELYGNFLIKNGLVKLSD